MNFNQIVLNWCLQVKSTFDYLKEPMFQDIDFIIYTGDTARHVKKFLIYIVSADSIP